MTGAATLLTVDEVAERLRVKPRTVRDEITRKNLRASKVTNRWLVSPADLQKYLDSGLNVARTA